MSSSALHQVNNAAKCILFVDAVRLHLLEYDALFWWNSIFGTVAEKAAAAPRMTRAARLEAKIEAEIEAWLGAPDARPQPMRLDMDGAEAASPPPAATAVPTPSALKMPPTAIRMCTIKEIEQTVLKAVATVAGQSFVQDLSGERTGTQALKKLIKIFSPSTPAAEAAAVDNYSDALRTLRKDTPLHAFLQWIRVLARIIKYYNATLTTPSKVIDDVRRAAINTFGDGSLLTTRLARFDPENPNFPPDPSERADLLEALFVQWDTEHGGRGTNLPGVVCGANSLTTGGGSTGAAHGAAGNPRLAYAFTADSNDAAALWQAVTANKPGRRPDDRGGAFKRQTIPAGPGGGARPAGTNICPWCMTFLKKANAHTFDECRNKNKPALLESLRQQGKLQADGTAVNINAARHTDAPHADAVERACVVCMEQHAGGTAACGYLHGVQELVKKHRAAMAQDTARGEDASTQSAPLPAGDLRTSLNASRAQALRLVHTGTRHAPSDRVYAFATHDQVGDPKRVRRGGRRMKRKLDLRAKDVLLGVDDPAFQVPKRRQPGEWTRQNEVNRLVHRHLLGAFDTLAAIQEVACEWPAAADTKLETLAIDSDIPAFTEHDSESVRAILGINTNANCESGNESDSASESLRAILGLSDDDSDSEASASSPSFSVSNKHDSHYSESFAQIDTGATKTVSSRTDLFHPNSLSPTQTRVQVADGRDIGGTVHSGTLNPSSGFGGLAALCASHIQGTLISQPQAVREQNLAFVHTPDACFAQPFVKGQCPICTPTPGRIPFIVRDSKILLPLPPPPQRHPRVPVPRTHLPTSGTQVFGVHGFRDGKFRRHTVQPAGTPAVDAITIDATAGVGRAKQPAGAPALASVSTQTDSLRSQQDVARKILWHGRMPTAGCQALSKLAEKFPGVFNFDPRTKLPPCLVCDRASIRKAAAPPESKRQVRPLEEVHFDLFFVHGEIVLMLIDRASRYEWIYFLNAKSDLPKGLQQFLIDCNSAAFTVGNLHFDITSTKSKGIDADALNKHLEANNLTQRVKAFYSDGAHEHASTAMKSFLLGTGIQNRHSIADCQHQNGIAENMGWNALKGARHDMDVSNMSSGFRRACLRLNIERRACTPRAALGWQTPFEILYPNLHPPFKYFKTFGTHCTVLKQTNELKRQGKLLSRGDPGVYIGTGHSKGKSGFLVWLPHQRKEVIAEHVLFHEHIFPARKDTLVPDICSALPGHTHAHQYRSTITDAALPEPILPAIPLPPPSSHPLLSPPKLSLTPTSQLSPLSKHIFTTLQQYGTAPGSVHVTASDIIHGNIQSDDDGIDDDGSVHAGCDGSTHTDTDDGPTDGSVPELDDPSATDATSEAKILLNETEAYALLARHFRASEGPYWKGYCQRPASPSLSATPFDVPSSTTKRLALDLITGDVVDAKGYVFAGENLLNSDACNALISRALIKALKTQSKEGDASARAHCVKTIALLRNPKTVREALASPEWSHWIAAIHAEMASLVEKGTFEISATPVGRKVIPTKVVLKIKMKSNGEIEKFKARICVLGFRQKQGLDFNPDQVYAPMTEPTTIRLLLAIANKLDLNIDHLDIKTAFLNGILPPEEQFYCSPPPGLSIAPGYCWKMLRGLYGAHQSGAIWAQTWRNWLHQHAPDFKEAGSERCVFVKREHADGTCVDLDELRDITLEPGERLVILVMNTDDLLVLYTDSARAIVNDFESLLNLSFEATPRAPVEQYLGMHVTRNRERRFLAIDGRRHVRDFIHDMGYDHKATTTVRTPLDPTIVYSKEDCPAEIDVALRAKVWSAHGKLIHLAVWTRPDLAHAVSVLGRYVHNPSEKLWLAYHRIAKYLCYTKDFRLVFGTNDPTGNTQPYGYTDSDWAADLDHRKSTGAYVFLLDGATCSWKVKLSPTVCLSTQQAEYYALTEGTKEALNLRFLLRDLGFGQSRPTELFCDNKGAITMSLHPANKPATRHIDMRIHFCRQHVEAGDVTTTFAPTPAMVADFMTKQTLRLTHERHCRRVFGDQLAPLPLEPITRVVA